MAVMLSRLYAALKLANIPDEAAQSAAEEVAGYENRMVKIEQDLAVLKWITGANLALTLIVLGKLMLL